MIPFIIVYGGGPSVILDGNRDICCSHSTHFIIIHIILLAIFVFLGGQMEESDQTKAQRYCP